MCKYAKFHAKMEKKIHIRKRTWIYFVWAHVFKALPVE